MLAILFLLVFTLNASADVYVLTDQNNAVIGLSEQDDMAVPAGYTKQVVKNKKMKDIPISGDEKMYDFNGGNFTLNSKKVQDKNKSDSDAITANQTRKALRDSAITKLKTVVNLTDDEIASIIRK